MGITLSEYESLQRLAKDRETERAREAKQRASVPRAGGCGTDQPRKILVFVKRKLERFESPAAPALPDYKEKVLKEIAGRGLNRARLEDVLANAAAYGFSPAEIEELNAALAEMSRWQICPTCSGVGALENCPECGGSGWRS